jgi:Cof subfamily protein (haloacid dehalogenase superfamily)
MTVIATDLDGTLLRSDATLSDRTRSALRSARQAGIRVVAATARPYRVLDEIFGGTVAEEPLIDVAICGNGCGFYDLTTKRATFMHLLDAQLVRDVIKAILEHVPGAGFAVETGHRVLFEPGYAYTPRHDKLRFPVGTYDELLAEQCLKLMVWLPERNPATVWERLSPALASSISCTWSGEQMPLEITAAGVSKAVALEEMCRSWGVTAAEVVAFGDAANDLPMMAWAGTSYAVANASPAVLAAATARTASNDDDGVAIIIERVIEQAGVEQVR